MEKNYPQNINFLSEEEIKNFLEKDKESFISIIPKGINDKKELMQAYYDRLNLPPYFGGNWDALDEVLIDFGWINAKNIFIIHQDMPKLPEQDSALLIRILSEAVSKMRTGHTPQYQLPTGKHTLRVIFPESCREEIRLRASQEY